LQFAEPGCMPPGLEVAEERRPSGNGCILREC
jgi:hypothetical protein